MRSLSCPSGCESCSLTFQHQSDWRGCCVLTWHCFWFTVALFALRRQRRHRQTRIGRCGCHGNSSSSRNSVIAIDPAQEGADHPLNGQPDSCAPHDDLAPSSRAGGGLRSQLQEGKPALLLCLPASSAHEGERCRFAPWLAACLHLCLLGGTGLMAGWPVCVLLSDATDSHLCKGQEADLSEALWEADPYGCLRARRPAAAQDEAHNPS